MTPRSSRFQMVWILLYSGPNLSSGLFMSGSRPFLDDQPAAGDAGGEHGGLRLGGEDGGDVAGAGGAGGGVTHQPHHARRIRLLAAHVVPVRLVAKLAEPDAEPVVQVVRPVVLARWL